ncbi:MAG TPA: hypothetical protein VIG24_11365 [Acidimicrobiia bacterium]
MTAISFDTYADYCAARAAQGLQVLSSTLWRALKENNPALVERAPLNVPATT